MTPQKIASIIVTYFPTFKVSSLIQQAINQQSPVIIVDNATDPEVLSQTIDPSLLSQVECIHLVENMGIAYAQNRGLEKAIELNCMAVILFDQDSQIPKNYYQSMISAYQSQKGQVGVIGTKYLDLGLKQYGKAIAINKWSTEQKDISKLKQGLIPSDFIIASGSFFVLDLYKQYGGMKDSLFIDHVDTEFVLRLKLAGIKSFINCEVEMQHAIGNREERSLVIRKIRPAHHNHIRRFFMARNSIEMMRLFGQDIPIMYYIMLRKVLHDFICITFFEKHKLQKLTFLMYGLYYGLKRELGPLPYKLRNKV